jgi:hypothetical protein
MGASTLQFPPQPLKFQDKLEQCNTPRWWSDLENPLTAAPIEMATDIVVSLSGMSAVGYLSLGARTHSLLQWAWY